MSAQILSPEDQARADFYGLLARLFYAPPDTGLLRMLAGAEDLPAASADLALPASWKELKRAAAEADAETVREEYENLFIGTGKAEVTLYSSAYLARSESWSAARPPLVVLRDFLAERGLARKHGVHEPEDHIAGLCEVMRHLVGENDLDAQRDFYRTFLAPSAGGLCAAIKSASRVRFYSPVAQFAAAFFELEQEIGK
jgi:TorA maturation chaperone TorD